MEKLLDFERNKVQAITLDQLGRTHKENDVYGNPLRGIYHYELITRLGEMCREQGFEMEIYDMFAAQNRERMAPGVVLLPQVEAQYGKNAVEAHILRRVFANIRLKDLDDDENTTCLAVAYHQRGIQVGFGNMVKVCHNQCIMHADQYMATYGDRGNGRGTGHELPEVLEAVRTWLADARDRIMREREKMEAMKAIDVPAAHLFALIGMLTAIRVKVDTTIKDMRTNVTYPLNQAQICRFTEALLYRYHCNQRVSVWDVYNAATDLYKAEGMDIPNMLPQNRAMMAFLDDNFSLPRL